MAGKVLVSALQKGVRRWKYVTQWRENIRKSFKFIGWHPNCKCYAVPIIANEGTDRDFWEEPLNEVKDVPDNFKRWVEDNTERIEKAKNLPYFIGENKNTSMIRCSSIAMPYNSWQKRST